MNTKIIQIAVADYGLYGVDEEGKLYRWNDIVGKWTPQDK